MKVVYWGYNSFKTHKRGVENVIEFQSQCYDFDLIYYIHWGEKTEAYKCGQFIAVSIRKCWFWPILFNYVMRKIKKRGSLLVHSHNPLYSIICLYRSDVLTVHDGLFYLTKSRKHPLKMLFWLLEKILYVRCDKIHFISEYTKSKTLYPKNNHNFFIIPNSSHFEKLVIDDLYFLENQSVSKDKFIVLSVRSVEERARFDLLIAVAKMLKDEEFEFIVAGKGPLLEYYKKVIKDEGLKNINLLGYVNDAYLLQLYKECDLVLNLAQYGEGFGLPIIEGYLFNKPVVASNCCAIPEVIISKEYLCENNVSDIVSKIQMCKYSYGENFRKYYFDHFSNKYVAHQFRKMLIMGKKNE